jgi:hypothetical protein
MDYDDSKRRFRLQCRACDMVLLVLLAGLQGWLVRTAMDGALPPEDLLCQRLGCFFFGALVALCAGYLAFRYNQDEPRSFWKRALILLGLDLGLLFLRYTILLVVFYCGYLAFRAVRLRGHPDAQPAAGQQS